MSTRPIGRERGPPTTSTRRTAPAASDGIARAIDDLQRRSVRVPEIEARTVDRPALAVLLEEDVHALAKQRGFRGLVCVRVDHEGVMDAIRHLGLAFLNRRWPLDQQQAHAAGIEEGDLLVRQLREELATDNFGVELCALVDIADRNAEVSNPFEFDHALLHRGRSATLIGLRPNAGLEC